MRRSPLAAIALVLFAACLVIAGCSTEPIKTGSASNSASTAHLRTGPQTATVTTPAIRPVADNPAPTLPVTVPSIGTGPVTVKSTDRIIALDRNGTLGTIVYSLGLGSHVVARDQSTTFPQAAALPVVTGGAHQVDVEAVLKANPTVVLADELTGAAALNQLRSSGITVVVFSGDRSVDGAPTLIEQVAAALGVPGVGKTLADRTRTETADAIKKVPQSNPRPKIAFMYLRGSLQFIAGKNSSADGLITALGGTDAGADAGLTTEFTQITPEAMIDANPDVLLVMSQGADSVGGMDAVLKLPGIAQTNAGRERRIVQMDQTELLAFGPDTGAVITALAQAMYK